MVLLEHGQFLLVNYSPPFNQAFPICLHHKCALLKALVELSTAFLAAVKAGIPFSQANGTFLE